MAAGFASAGADDRIPPGPPALPPVRVALMGCGRWGSNLARVLARLPEFDLIAVADPDPAARVRAAGIAPGAALARDIEEVAPGAEAVVVCTPSGDHASHGESLLARGLHVLVEKPMALDVETAERLRARAAESGVLLAVGHQLLRHACWEALMRLVSGGRIGPVRRIRAVRSGRCRLEQELGVLWSLGPHDASLVLELAGRAPAAVRAELLAAHPTGWPAAVRVRLEYEGGPDVELLLDGDTDRRARRFEVFGDLGRVAFEDATPGGRLLLDTIDGGPQELRVTADEPLARHCLGFWGAIRRGDPSGIADGGQGAEVIRVLAAAEADLGPETARAASFSSSACR
jgi:predicted dehydrogenase